MNYDIKRTTQFKKDVKLMLKQGRDIQPMLDVIEMLRTDTPLPEQFRDHALSGNWFGKRECHIDPDWLLIYEKHENLLLLTLLRTGSHSTILRK
jgi:mRNA interferase YafQ